jgi:hypothetical protein
MNPVLTEPILAGIAGDKAAQKQQKFTQMLLPTRIFT